MGIDFSAIFNILTNPPGDLIYHLVVTLSLIVTMGVAVVKTDQSPRGGQARHILIGCGTLLLLQIVLFSLRMLNAGTVAIIPLAVGIIERLTSALTIMWLVWTFFEQDTYFFFSGLNLFLSLALIFIASILIFLITLLPSFAANTENLLNILWQMGTLFIILIGLIIILAYRPHQWVVTAAMLFMLAAGHILQLTPAYSDTVAMGAVRFAQSLSLPWMMVLVQRLGQQKIESAPEKELPEPEIEEKIQKLVDTKPDLMDLLLKIPLLETSEEKFNLVVRALSLSVVSDICLLLGVPEEKDEIYLIKGYDLIREEFISRQTLSHDDLPLIVNAWDENQILKLSNSDSDAPDAATIKRILKYHRFGNLFAYPLALPNGEPIGGVIFLSPYTNKQWGQDTSHLMDVIQETLTRLLFTADPLDQLKATLAQAQNEITRLIEEKESLSQKLKDKDADIDEQKAKIKQLKAKYQIEKLETVQQIEQLQEEIRGQVSQVTDHNEIRTKLEQMEMENRQLTAERDQLKIALARAKARITDLETQTGQTGPIRLSMQNQIISLDSIAANVRLRIASQLQQKNIDLKIINPDGRQMIKTDPELLQTAIVGLLENAIKASDPGGSVQLNQKLSFETGMLQIQVTDHGEGLTQAEQTAFFSADHVSIPGIGSVQSIRDAIRAIRVLNGKIWLRSKKNVFTTFRVQLPVRIID